MEGGRGIRSIIKEYFRNLFTTGGQCDWGSLLDCVKHVVTAEMNEVLTRPVDDEKIKCAVFQMGNLKPPGPDGFQGVFFQSFWEIISPEVKGLAADFVNGSTSPTDLNDTHIICIPKTPHPETLNQFRPISLCNYSYKVL